MWDLKGAWVAMVVILLTSCAGTAKTPPSKNDPGVKDRTVSEIERQLLGRRWMRTIERGSTRQYVTWAVFEDGGELTVVNRWEDYGGGRPKAASPIRGKYRVTPTGTVEFKWTGNDRREAHRWTFAVIDSKLTQFVHSRLSEVGDGVWTNGGLRAQDAEGRRFRGEWSIEIDQSDRKLERRGFVSELVFEKPPVSGERCRFRLNIAVKVLQGGVESFAQQSFDMTCRVEPIPGSPLHHIHVDGFVYDTRVIEDRWSDFLDGLEIKKKHGQLVYETFREAFLPVLYFDSSNPRLLVHPSSYEPYIGCRKGGGIRGDTGYFFQG